MIRQRREPMWYSIRDSGSVVGSSSLGFGHLLTAIAMGLCAACGGADSSGDATGQVEETPVGGVSTANGVRATVPIQISGEIGNETVRASGPGECTHAEQAYIRGVPSKMWHVQYTGGDEDDAVSHTSLAIWRPDGGGVDQVAFSMESRSESHRVNTVVGSEPEGSGTVVLSTEGEGIRVALDGKDAEGTVLRLTILCARLTPATAEGG